MLKRPLDGSTVELLVISLINCYLGFVSYLSYDIL